MATHHAIDYIELSAPDLAAAKAFYGAAFGWTFTDYGDAYVGFSSTGGEEDGGFNPASTPVAGGPLVLVYSDDLAAPVPAVRAAGGTISVEPFAFPGGRRFHFRDPSGNELGAWTRP